MAAGTDLIAACGLCAMAITAAVAAEPPAHRAMPLAESLSPYTGPVVRGVDTTTLHGTVLCGYQGWFMAKGDGYEPGFVHWGGVDRAPPRCTVDFWPDTTELEPDERFPTNYRHADGTRAEVFSSTVRQTVLRHFRWMQEYGIDGVYVQRFGSCIGNQRDWNYQRTCAVLNLCREGANRSGRAYAVMYDMDFGRRGVDVVMADWTRLIREMQLTRTPAYLRHRGAPVVGLWGYGFGHRAFEAAAAEDLFRFLKDPANGACTILLGVPNDWASWEDDRMRLLTRYATVISPWNVGRYGDPEGARRHAARYWPGDLTFCREHDLEYYAVAFPGFSWANLQKGNSPLNQTPRLGGRFFWSQIEEIRRHGMDNVYVAMFDEVDEGTAIFKCTNHPPVGRFCTYEGLPSDTYLRLAGLAGRFLRGEQVTFPEIAPDPAGTTYTPLPQLVYYREPSPFSEATTRRWQEWFAGNTLLLHEEPYSAWIRDLYNTDAFDIRLMTWRDIVVSPPSAGLMLLAPGNEGFNARSSDVAEIVRTLQRHLQRGGILVIMAGGAYPLFYPGHGSEAARFGFRLEMTNSPRGSRIVFAEALPKGLPAWTMDQGGTSRLMRRELYPEALAYQSLGRVELPDGAIHGDAMALVQPGGPLGKGQILYLASDLLRHPEREGLLDAVLAFLHSRLRQ
ncbi:MAG: hypothetical protein JXR77_16535 [Lentisphaeria bacterium]|nr:hypothetical protein [Lentisphaeria bacterium]